MRRFGFTGTSEGMTALQRAAFRDLLLQLQVEALDLGDCVGADAEAHADVTELGGIVRVGHPPSNPTRRAFLEYDEVWPEKPYHARNEDIVRCGSYGLIAAPPTVEENPGRGRGGGTWSTVRRGRKWSRIIWKVLPDGRVEMEEPGQVR